MMRLYPILARRHVLLVSFCSALVLMILLQATANERGGSSVFSLQLAFTADNFRAVLESWSADGITHFQQTLWLDYLFPLAYACSLAGIIARLRPAQGDVQPPRLPLVLFTASFLAALADYTENTLHLIILSDTAALSAPLILPASIAATLKWGLITIDFLAIIYYLGKKALDAIARHNVHKPTKEIP